MLYQTKSEAQIVAKRGGNKNGEDRGEANIPSSAWQLNHFKLGKMIQGIAGQSIFTRKSGVINNFAGLFTSFTQWDSTFGKRIKTKLHMPTPGVRVSRALAVLFVRARAAKQKIGRVERSGGCQKSVRQTLRCVAGNKRWMGWESQDVGRRVPDAVRQMVVWSVVAVCVFLAGMAHGDQSAVLSWNRSPGSGVAGYRVYMGTASGNYATSIDVGTNTTTTITGLKEGTTNYFAVTAYNAARLESLPSGEIAFLAPGLIVPAAITKSGNPFSLTFPVAPGHYYDVQASVDLTNWVTIWRTAKASSNAWVTFQDPQTSAFSKRFYRLVLH